MPWYIHVYHFSLLFLLLAIAYYIGITASLTAYFILGLFALYLGK